MADPFAIFARSLVSITSDVLIATCATVDQKLMLRTLLDSNTNIK